MLAAAALLIGGVLLVLGVIVGPELPGGDTGNISLLAVLVIGLTAGGLSCLAIQGGLLAVAVADDRMATGPDDGRLGGKLGAVVSFLVAKLVAYTLLGAALGALGQLAQPSVGLRVGIQIATAFLMIATALHLLGVHPVFRYVILQPPRFLTRRISATASGGRWFAPALLGALTIFLPCGVTQAMELVAINSGDPLTGAAILATFVAGTSVLFLSAGYLATSLGGVAQKQLVRVAAVAILVVAVISLDAAARLAGSPVTIASATDALFAPPRPVAALPVRGGGQEARITAGPGGYSPSRVQVKAGQPVRVIFLAEPTAGCALALIFGQGQHYLTPADPTVIDIPPMATGQRIDYTCAMGMYGGSVEAVG